MKSLENKIPRDIIRISKKFPIIDYQEKYGEDVENIAKGEIEKFNFARGMKYDVPIVVPAMHWYDENSGKSYSLPEGKIPRRDVGQRVLKLVRDENGNEYDTIWIHLGRDYFKQISKVLENRTC